VEGDADCVREILPDTLSVGVTDAVTLMVGDGDAVTDAVRVVDGAVPASVKHSKLPAGHRVVPLA
jgi:hypothetical protein